MEEKTTNSRMAGAREKPDTVKNKSLGRSWFLGIGIDHYQHFPNLNNAVKDVKDVLTVLKADYDLEPENVITLFDEQATRSRIITELDQLKRRLRSANKDQLQDKLIIYFSGHGHLDEDGKGFWIPTDASKDSTAFYISNSRIREYIEDLKALHTLLISDACFSGSLFKHSGISSDKAIEDLEKAVSRWALTSGRRKEPVQDGHPGDNSPFAKSILYVLKQNDRPKLKVSTFIDRVMDLTRQQGRQLPQGYPLTIHEGQYIFCRRSLDEDAWNTCRQEDTVDAYRLFVRRYPKSRFHALAAAQLSRLEAEEMWGEIRGKGLPYQYTEFVRKYPTSPHAQEAIAFIKETEKKEKERWNRCRKMDTLSAYLDYLITYPSGQYVLPAQERIDELQQVPAPVEPPPATPAKQPAVEEEDLWRKIRNSRTADDFQQYLQLFPSGRYADDANRKIKIIDKGTSEVRRELEEKKAWEAVRNKKLIREFQAFPKAYPNSQHRAEAERKTEEIRAKRKKRSANVPDSKVADWVKRGRKYLFGDGYKKNHGKALELFKKAAAQGNPTGEYYLGFMYNYGFGTLRDYKKAAYWYRKAAAQGQVEAQTALGMLYNEGKGVQKDPKQALKWFQKAAEQGDPFGQVRLGMIYFYGWGLPQDHQKAHQWMLKAAKKGESQAQYNLGILYANGYGVAKDARAAAEWYRKAAEQGNADAQYNLGVLYEQDEGLPQHYQEAAKWYQKAAGQGDASAQNNLGVLYKNGKGVSRDYTEAVKWFLAAARQGDRAGQYNLGIMYRDGKGVHQNLEEAAKYFQKSAGQGAEEAQKALSELQNKSENPESGLRGALRKIRDFLAD